MKRSLTVALLSALALSCSSLYSQEAAPRSFYSVTEIISNWSPDQHLWTHGELGVSANQLRSLETWLDQQAPNWTVVLLETATSQRFDGRRGMTAVEFALGKGLSNQTGFGELTHPVTGQKNGAVFVLFLKERKFSYFASEVYDKRGLGERYWIGRLDRPAINAMRNGGRVVDAVKDTITSIDSSLSKKLKEENERKRLAEVERQRAIDEAKLYAGQLRSLIQEAEGRAADLRKQHPGLTGAVVRPALVPWRAEAETVARLAEQGDHKNARKHFTDTQNSIETFHEEVDQWEDDSERFTPLQTRIENHPTPEKAPLVAGHLGRAAEALASAKENHASGDPLYREQLSSTERYLANAKDAYDEWDQTQRLQKLVLRVSLITLVLILVVFAGIANRLRRPFRDEAIDSLKHWRRELDGKFDQLFNLLSRTNLIVGNAQDLKEQGYEGTTSQLAEETIHGVDELYIMSAATDQVMSEVESLIYPRSLPGQLLNTISRKNYRKAFALLTSAPIGFDQQDHLEAILHPSGSEANETYVRTLLGELEDYEPFRISFEELISAYDRRQAAALDGLSRLEAGIDGLPMTQQDLESSLDQLSLEAAQLANLAEEDSFFPLISLRETLIPAVRASLDDATQLGEKDPVASFETVIPESSRLLSEARAVTSSIESFRTSDLPEIRRARERLTDNERETDWIETSLSKMSARSEQLTAQAASVPIEEAWAEFDDDLIHFKGRALNCKQLTQRIKEELNPLIETRSREIIEARRSLSQDLGIDATRLLKEPNLSPDDSVAKARQGISTAITSIDHGHATAARESLAEVETCLDDVVSLIAFSWTSAEQHADQLQKLHEGHKTVSAEVVPAHQMLEEFERDYASTTLLFSSRFNEEIAGQKSIAESINRAQRRLDQSSRELVDSAEAFNSGELIRAYSLLETVANELDFARHQLALIHDQYDALKKAEAGVNSLTDLLETRRRELKLLCEDRRTCQSTLDDFEVTARDLDEWHGAIGADPPDPFQLQHQGDALKLRFNAVEDGIESDWRAFDLAESSATGAKAALTFCHTYLREARTDEIPDSRALTRAIQRHGELVAELQTIEIELEGAHAEWNELFGRISAITGETAKVRSTLKEELAAAREAAEQLAGATRAIRDLHEWRSSYSVRPDRKAGKPHLLRAKQALFKGDYAIASRAASAAIGDASRALARAKLREAKKEREAAAAARRARLLSSSSVGSSFSSGSSFGSSFGGSSSSGFSGSSFSSGSGFSRSGW